MFTLEVAENWYDQQIAFAGIPWSRFASRPGTSLNAAERGAVNDEMNLIVYDKDGTFTGSKGNTLLQLPGISKGRNTLTVEGSNNFYVEIVNKFANFIFAVDNPLVYAYGSNNGSVDTGTTSGNINFGKEAVGTAVADGVDYQYIQVQSYVLGGGADQLVATLGERQIGYDRLTNEEYTTLDYVLQGPSEGNIANSISLANFIISIVEERRYIPLNADVAGCMVRSSILAEPWFSPAGLSRGQILNVTSLPYNPSKKQRDLLYPARINPVVTFPGEGTVLFGDKTALAYTSAFDRINVRKLFLIVEKQIAKLSRVFLFEFNDEITRALFKNNVNPFLRDVQAKRGIFDFLVVCDETNNTPEVIDRNEFIADIYIKPSRSINFITLNFVATKTGVSFDESIALFRRTGG